MRRQGKASQGIHERNRKSSHSEENADCTASKGKPANCETTDCQDAHTGAAQREATHCHAFHHSSYLFFIKQQQGAAVFSLVKLFQVI